MGLIFQSQSREAGRAREGCSPISWLVDRIRNTVFGGYGQDHSLPRPICVSDGVADRRCVPVAAERAGLRHGHEEARQRYRHGLSFAFAERRKNEERSRLARLIPGEDAGEEGAVVGTSDIGLAETIVQCARGHLRTRVVHRPLLAPHYARSGFDCACCVHPLYSGCQTLRNSGRYVPSNAGWNKRMIDVF